MHTQAAGHTSQVLNVELISAFSDTPVAPLILVKKLLLCLLGCDLFLCVCGHQLTHKGQVGGWAGRCQIPTCCG